MAELVLSPSSVDAYLRCEYRWYLEYVERREGEQSVAAAVGLAVHEGVEHWYRALLEQPLEAREDLEIALLRGSAEAVFDLALLREWFGVVEPEEKLEKMQRIGRRVLAAYIDDVGTQTVPRYVELPRRFRVNGIEMSVHVDLIDVGRIVHDLKVKGSKPRDPGVFTFQMITGALAFRELTGEIETDVQIDVMIRLKRDRPYHVPYNNGGAIDDHDISVFATQLERVANGIERRSFRPNGLEKGACRWCPVANACEPYQETLRLPTPDPEDAWMGNMATGAEHWD